MNNNSEQNESIEFKEGSLRRRTVIGRIILAILFIASIATIGVLEYVQVLPNKYIFLGAFVLLIIFAVLGAVMRFKKANNFFYVGAGLASIMSVLLIIGSVYMIRGRLAFEEISKNNQDKTEVCVYVLKDDKAKNIKDAKNYSFGVLANQDEDITKRTVNYIKKDVGKSIKTKGLDNVNESFKAIRSKKVDALILKKGYLDSFDDIEGFENISKELKVIATYEIKTDSEQKVSGKLKDTFAVYISGIDTEGDPSVTSRSDVNIIAFINVKTHQVMLLSTPRDYYVKIPGVSKGNYDKLTHAGLYGINKSIDTLEDIYGCKIDYYFRLNFTGFRNIIDALGGIEVDSDYKFTAHDGQKYSKGINKLNGARALSFARERKAFKDMGDEQRGIDQMKVIKAVVKKCMSTKMLTNYESVLKSIESSFEMNIPYSVISELVQLQLDEGQDWTISTYHATGCNAKRVPYSLGSRAYVMLPSVESIDEGKRLIKEIYSGKKLNQDLIEKEEKRIRDRAENGILTKDDKKVKDLYDSSDDSSYSKSKYSDDSTESSSKTRRKSYNTQDTENSSSERNTEKKTTTRNRNRIVNTETKPRTPEKHTETIKQPEHHINHGGTQAGGNGQTEGGSASSGSTEPSIQESDNTQSEVVTTP
ncbi:LCP family protein [Lachnobacterium bovis]|uniref:LCP family protein n=1 Tax=Lachnobacterium bovis TaxID=140626 RepID=UPI0006887937|nr:LCP family protein [Lachnobacterium bovis]